MSEGHVLLFDLGGVLVEYTGVRDIAPLLPAPASESEISSHHVGLLKPDPAIDQAALDRLKVLASAVVFFDDAPENVAAASAIGMRAFQVDGVDGVRERLTREGLV